MTPIGTLYETNKMGVLAQLRAIQRTHGHVSVGVVSASILAAVSEFVRETQGPEAAFNMLTRHADEAIEPVVGRTPEPKTGA